MSVYVDDMRPCISNVRWHNRKSCHLVADAIDELHEFALLIGLKRSWFQDNVSLHHYDLTENKRAAAILNGAIEINRKQIVGMIRDRRANVR